MKNVSSAPAPPRPAVIVDTPAPFLFYSWAFGRARPQSVKRNALAVSSRFACQVLAYFDVGIVCLRGLSSNENTALPVLTLTQRERKLDCKVRLHFPELTIRLEINYPASSKELTTLHCLVRFRISEEFVARSV